MYSSRQKKQANECYEIGTADILETRLKHKDE